MIRFKERIRTVLLVVCCFAVCLAIGTAKIEHHKTGAITANAETVYTEYTATEINAANGSSSNVLYIYPAKGVAAFPNGGNDWEHVYAFEQGSGDGMKLNEETLTTEDIKLPGTDLYIGLGKDAQTGDIFTIDGAYYNEDTKIKLIFDNCSLVYKGNGKWDSYVKCTEYTVSDLTVHSNSTTDTVLWISMTGGATVSDWPWFEYERGAGFKVNGETAELMGNKENAIQDFGGGLYLTFAAVNAGDVVSIGGTFVNEELAIRYIIPETYFQWNGSGWVSYAPPVEYTQFNVGKLAVKSGDDSSVYFKPATAGITFPIDSWEAPFSYVSGNGITVNGTMINMENSVKSPSGDLYVGLGQPVSTGAILKIGGVLRCEAFTTDYVIEDSSFKWNGSAWVDYVEYTQFNVGKLAVKSGDDSSVYFKPATAGITFPIDSWDAPFSYVSGNGITVNGTMINMENSVKSPSGDLYVGLGQPVSTGAILKIGGVLRCEAFTTDYVIEDSSFKWNGSAWETYIEYTEYNVGTLTVNPNSAPGANTAVNTSLYLIKENGSTVDDWTYYTYVSGAGFKVNNETATLNAIQNVGSGLYLAFEGVDEGDVISIEGTYVCDSTAIKYVIPESKFVWNGSGWETYVEYTIHNLGALELHVNSSVGGASGLNNVLYLQIAGGEALPILDWNHVFTYESGDGWMVNGVGKALTTMKSTNDGLYLDFEAVPTNAVVSISGTFVYSQAPVKYVIDESKFVWNGSAWEKYIEYTEYNVGTLTVNPNSAPGAGTAVSTSLYLLKEDGSTVDDWTYYTYVSGAGFKVNGETATLNAIQNVGSGLYLAFAGVSAGDVISIEGTYKCANTALRYIIDEAHFTWTGSGWIKCYADSQLAAYDVVTLVDLGLGVEKTVEGEYDGSQNTYTASAENTTGSVKFRFQVNSVDTTNGAMAIRLRGSAWSGVRFEITEGVIRTWNETANSQRLPLSNNTDYIIELGAIDVLNSDYIWAYISIDGVFMASEMLLKTETSDTDGAEYGTYNTNAVSIYVSTTKVTITDPDHVSVTYTATNGSSVEYVEKGSNYAVLDVKAKTYDTFIGWVYNDALYFAGDEIQLAEENITLTALELDFRLKAGASIRLAGTADTSGIRFTTLIEEADLNGLVGNYGIASVSYGTLIIPYDYLAADQEPNLEDFTSGENILKIASTYSEVNADGFIVYRGAMQNLYEENYGRLFAGRGYMEITLENGETITVYTPFDKDDNVRSIRQIAQAFQADTSEPDEGEIRYATLSETRKDIVDAYAALDEIELMNYASYAANNFFNVIAWNYPALDESDEYNNEKNIAIATKMKNAGIKVVNLTGLNLLVLNTQEAIEKTHQIIKFFWSQGLKTVAFAANNVENFNTDFTQIGTPDFSDCEGFIGFLHWDEPTGDDTTMSKLADLAIQFNNVYAGTDVTYMNNLLPSSAPYFQTTETNWWGGSSTTLDKAAYKAYVEEYCETVLSQVKGEKWLSVDSYPINKDESLHDTFLLDLGVIKYYAMQYGAHAHVALQSSGFGANENDTKARIPTEAEMRMQAYAALAFGMDSISWFTYSPSGSDSENFYTFVDNDGNIIDQTAYDAFAKVNNELSAIGAVYSAFKWKGIILGRGDESNFSDWSNEDYNAYSTVMGQIGDYQLSVDKTKHLSSVATNKNTLNYLMGVMQDANGNEGYVLCNYNSHKEDRAQTITLTFNKNITEVVIYRGGVAETRSVTNNTIAIDLATGEGVIVLPSKLG